MRRICLSVIMLGALAGKAQTTWYFGTKAKLQFTVGGIPTALSGSSLTTAEGSAVLVDNSNNVVMYCNGQDVLNGNNLNQSIPLSGDQSSTQTALIVPIGGTSPQLAFIFNVSSVERNYGAIDSKDGLRATLVSIGGTAPATTVTAIGTTNVNLAPGILMSEKLSVTEDGNGGFWVLAHGVGMYSGVPSSGTLMNAAGERNFYAYHVTCSTTNIALLDATEVVSTISNVNIAPMQSFSHTGSGPYYTDPSQLNGQGQLKFSANGLKIVNTLSWYGRSGSSFNPVAQLFNFNKSTGAVDNVSAIQFNLGFQTTGNKDAMAYGVEFSPSGNLLYVTSHVGSSMISGNYAGVYQYNISSGVPATITSSKVQVYNAGAITSIGSTAALMIGPDKKIYVARYGLGSIDVINNPDASGSACNYSPLGVSLGGNSCLAGLPTTVLVTGASTPTIIGNNCKSSISFGIGYTGRVPESYNWAVYGSDANGNPINSSGNVVSYASQSFYFESNYATPPTWTPGTPPSVIIPPGLNSAAICNKYYTFGITLKSECGTQTRTTRITIQVKCNDPSFSMSSNTGNTAYFTLAATPNDIAASSNPGFGYAWIVEDLNASNAPIFTMLNLSNWWIGNTATNDFKDFDHVANPLYSGTYSSLPPPSPVVPNGKFLYAHNYRITRGTWDAVCSWRQFSGIANYTPHRNTDGTTTMDVTFVEDKTAPDFSYLINQIPTDVKTLGESTRNSFVVYPNPSSGIFTVELNNEEKATMEVFDITGKVIKAIQLTKNDRYTLDLSEYAKGIYMIKMNGAQQQLQKIIIE